MHARGWQGEWTLRGCTSCAECLGGGTHCSAPTPTQGPAAPGQCQGYGVGDTGRGTHSGSYSGKALGRSGAPALLSLGSCTYQSAEILFGRRQPATPEPHGAVIHLRDLEIIFSSLPSRHLLSPPWFLFFLLPKEARTSLK